MNGNRQVVDSRAKKAKSLWEGGRLEGKTSTPRRQKAKYPSFVVGKFGESLCGTVGLDAADFIPSCLIYYYMLFLVLLARH